MRIAPTTLKAHVDKSTSIIGLLVVHHCFKVEPLEIANFQLLCKLKHKLLVYDRRE